MKPLIIAIDGPAGAGKSTLGKSLATALDLLYVDSGAVYRAIGLKAVREGVDLADEPALGRLAHAADVRLEGDPDRLRVVLDGREVTGDIRLPEASNASSVVATIPAVREAVVDKLRLMGRDRGVVMDGRDIGTRVFPDATLKLFLDASAEVRARRRCEEETARGRLVSLAEVQAEIEDRDRRDSERAATPLVKADDALLIETSHLDPATLLERVLEIVKLRS
jgi:cytidylate kinase